MAEDKYTLPETHACYAALELYKRYITPYIADYWQDFEYKAYVMAMEQWQLCCPGSENNSVKFRPNKTPVASFSEIRLPAVIDTNAPCSYQIHQRKSPGAEWFQYFSDEQRRIWDNHFSGINNNLYACCVQQFNNCLEQAARPQRGTAGGTLTSAASTSCFERFSPEHQRQAAAERAATQTKQQSETGLPTRKGTGQATTCADELSRVRKEYDQCQEEAQQSEQESRVYIEQLTKQLAGEREESARSYETLKATIVPLPGSEMPTASPSGGASAALVVFGVLTLIAGYFLGLPGRSRRRSRMVSGGVSALVALGVYLVSFALLPDMGFSQVFLAVTVAVLVVALRALARSQLELRQRGPAPPSP